MTADTAIIHGTGLIGASVGLALRANGWKVTGWDPDPKSLREAARRGALDEKRDSPDTTDAELVVLASPPGAIVASLTELSTDALVTDVAGVKTPIIAAATHLTHFVGGHPMAGGETSGAAMATSSMFHGATWVLTTDGAQESDLERLGSIVGAFGANPMTMTAAEHDAAVAVVSHLPHLLAAALLNLADDHPVALSLAGGGFRDLTRVAASGSGWWTEVLEANAEQIDSSLAGLGDALEMWRASIRDRDPHAIARALDAARMVRSGLGEHNSQVRVILLDRPGEIARVGHALEASKVDVRDFQLRHGEHGGGGILTISVRPSARSALEEAVMAEGFELQWD